MKRCPECYAIMRETKTEAKSPLPEQGGSGGQPEMTEKICRYDCMQCGYAEEGVSREPVSGGRQKVAV